MHNLNEDTASNEFTQTVLALKAARLLKGICRKNAAALLGWSATSFEQIENGRCNFSSQRLQKIIVAYGYSVKEFERIRREPKLYLARFNEQKDKDGAVERKPRRNHYKIVTKEVRVIRILRKRKRLSQYQAAALCGYVPAGFGHLEVGRIDLKKERIEHILRCLGYKWRDFQELMDAPILRDELLDETAAMLGRLGDDALISAKNIIKALLK